MKFSNPISVFATIGFILCLKIDLSRGALNKQSSLCGIVDCPQPINPKTYGNSANTTVSGNETNFNILTTTPIIPSNVSEKPKWQDLRFLKDVIMKSTPASTNPIPEFLMVSNATNATIQNISLTPSSNVSELIDDQNSDSLGTIYKFYQKFRKHVLKSHVVTRSQSLSQIKINPITDSMPPKINSTRLTKGNEFATKNDSKMGKKSKEIVILNCTNTKSGSILPIKSALINNSLQTCTLKFRTFFHGPPIKVNVVLEMGTYSIIVWSNGKSSTFSNGLRWRSVEVNIGKRINPFKVVIEGVCQDPTIMPLIMQIGQNYRDRTTLQRNSSALLLDSLQLADCISNFNDVLHTEDVGEKELKQNEYFTFTRNEIEISALKLKSNDETIAQKDNGCRALNTSNYFACGIYKNSLNSLQCIPNDKVCDLVPDCPNGEDEAPNVCDQMPQGSMCNFEDGWCGWENEEIRDKMQWFHASGFSSSGPKIDHTFANASGHYLHFTGDLKGSRLGHSALLKSQVFHPLSATMAGRDDETKIISPDIYDTFFKKCKIRFWYHMYGPHTGALELWVNHFSSVATELFGLNTKAGDDNLPYDPRDQGSFHRIWRAFGESEDVWKKVELPLFQPPNLPESFFLEFIAKRGLMDQGDVAIDDISLSKHCFGLTDDHLGHMNFSAEDWDKDKSPFDPFINIIAISSKENGSISFNQTVFKFDNCQSTGRLGPNLEMCEASLATNHETKQNLKTNKILPMTHNQTLNNSSISNQPEHLLSTKLFVTSDEKYAGIQAWKVQQDGYYKFTALGARGGRGALNPNGYGKGAQVTGHLELKAGEVIFMLIGQEGQDACKSFKQGKLLQNITEQSKVDSQISKICNDASQSVESSMWDYYERKGYAGGGGGGGGATYIFKFENASQTLVPLFVAAGGAGGSVKIANRLTNYQIYPKLDIHGQGFSPESHKLSQEVDQDNGDGYSNPKGAGGGGGWESALSMSGHRAHVISGSVEPSPSTTRAGGSLVTRGGKGGLGAAGCGHARGATLKKDSSSLWKTDGGFGGGGAPCTAGGGGGGWRGGDAPLGNSLYENGAGGRSYATSLAEKTEGVTGVNDKSGLVIVRAVLKNCPCSFKCTTIDPYAGKFQCLCPPDSLLARDGKTCRGKSWFRERPSISNISPRHLAFVILFAILFTISLSSCLIYLIMNQPRFRKKFLNRSPALLSPHETVDSSNFPASYQNGLPAGQIYAPGPGSKGGLLHYLAQLRREILAARSISPGYIEALNHELQLDELRQMGNANAPPMKQVPLTSDASSPPNANETLTWKRFMSLLQPQPSNTTKSMKDDRDISKVSLPLRDINPFYGKLNANETDKCCDSFIDTDLLYDYEGSQINEIPRDKLKLVKALGEGAFGEVYQGLLIVADKNAGNCQEARLEIPVAVKTLPENCKEVAEMDFFMEAFIMSKFNHKNIVKFYGTCLNNHPRFIVLEYLAGGDLRNFLREVRTNYPESRVGITFKELLELALDIANGCRYLEENHFVHRDIAARNCLLTSKLAPNRVAKIADFGMSRDVYRADYYRKGGKALLPVKWMPPEAFLDGLFTTKTDVWSFGVLLWEVFSLGYMPYPGCGNQEVMVKVSKGQRLDCPTRCPKTIYALMNECWHADPNQRPKFVKIVEVLTNFLTDPLIVKAKPIPRGTDHPTLNSRLAAKEGGQTLDFDYNNHHPAQSNFVKTRGQNILHAPENTIDEFHLTSPKNSQSTSGRGESLTWSCEVSDCSSQQTLHVGTLASPSDAPRLSDSLYSQCSSYDYLIPLNAPSSLDGCCIEPNKLCRDSGLLTGDEIPVFPEVEGDSTLTQVNHAYENVPFNVRCQDPQGSRQNLLKTFPHRARSQSTIYVINRDKTSPCHALSCFDIRKIMGAGQQSLSKDLNPTISLPIKITPKSILDCNQETKYAVQRLDSSDTTIINDAMRDSGIEDTTATLSSCCASSITESPNLTPKDIKFPTSIGLGF